MNWKSDVHASGEKTNGD